ncbi:RelA/SpoT domain-containing protein [Ochrobactrum sp. EDr1-4]|uniref:RelA/SpoT domain-containing protein n=1 Tax=Ochrobactrum sp. EDr1-4 TaxID=3368622 RepID=UPI003B9EF8C1
MEFDEKKFAEQCDLDLDKWEALGIQKKNLYEIHTDFKRNQDNFIEIAVSLSRLIQKLPGVHSVRWRIKDPNHLIRKIIRKKSSGVEKYENISKENYRDIVTDLIGIRALHLFKGDFPSLHTSIIETWVLDEEPIAYVRKGDTDDLRDIYKKLQLKVEEHTDGYRSIHYIIETNFTKKTVKSELQVRTIFEEGWSEIDHKIRYPDFSSNPLIKDFLHIFNRLSGAADEMGTFVNRLSTDLAAMTEERNLARSRVSDIEEQLNDKLKKIESISSKNTLMQSELRELKILLDRQKKEISNYPSLVESRNDHILGLGIDDIRNSLKSVETLRYLNISPSSFENAINVSKSVKDGLRLMGIGAKNSTDSDDDTKN